MTHVKNAASYSRLVDICTGLGGTYNPGHESLQVVALLAQQKEVRKVLSQVIDAKTNFDNVVNERKQVFRDLRRLTPSILLTLELNGASPEKLADVRAFVHQLLGVSSKRRTQAPAEGVAPVSKRSTLQLAYVSQADSFAKLIKAVATEPLYKTNDARLSVASLNETLKQLQTLNDRVSDARVHWSKALIQRNEVMYGSAASMFHSWLTVRAYLRSIFGLNSDQYAQLTALRFTKPGKQ